MNPLTPYEKQTAARDTKRPTAQNYIEGLLKNPMELHGDRCLADDGAIIAGLAYFEDIPVTYIAIEKGATIEQRVARNFGSPRPEGYRKSLRLMKQAEKFGRAVFCIVDTAGAVTGHVYIKIARSRQHPYSLGAWVVGDDDHRVGQRVNRSTTDLKPHHQDVDRNV
jgi:acetyl-CoA carboxylase alpha subunit